MGLGGKVLSGEGGEGGVPKGELMAAVDARALIFDFGDNQRLNLNTADGVLPSAGDNWLVFTPILYSKNSSYDATSTNFWMDG